MKYAKPTIIATIVFAAIGALPMACGLVGRGGSSRALINCSITKNVSCVRLLLTLGHPVDTRDEHGATALHYASARDQAEMVRLLLMYRADPATETFDGLDAVDINLINKHHDTTVLRLLVPDKDALERARSRGKSYLLISIDPTGSDEKSKYLVEAGDDVNFRSSFGGQFPLLYAAGNASAELTQALLEHGADPNMRNDDGETALMWAMRNKANDVVELLLQKGADQSIRSKSGKTAAEFADR